MIEPQLPVSIVIPTFRHPQQAVAAVRSAAAQANAGSFEIVAVDNDPAGSALGALQLLAHGMRMPLRVIHEPRAGAAHARNAGLAAARGRLVAFLDDGETAAPEWLAELMRVQAKTGADVVFGPVRTRLPDPGPPRHRAYFEAVFARDPGHAEGVIDTYYRCGCSLIRRDALPSAEPFLPLRNDHDSRGERLFATMKERGAVFAWAPGALAWRTPDASQLVLRQALVRAFVRAREPALASRNASRRAGVVAGMMLTGAGETLVHGATALVAWGARTPQRAWRYHRAAESLGKLLWFTALGPRADDGKRPNGNDPLADGAGA